VNTELTETVHYIRTHCRHQPTLGLILGSGFGSYADSFSDNKVLSFGKIPHFPYSTVAGHQGNLVFGSVEGIPCIALQGRVHLYEGYSMQEITFPIRVLGRLGIRGLIVANAAGGLNPEFRPGDLMLIDDHINMMGSNPLIPSDPLSGPDFDEPGPRFPDMSNAYDSGMREIALDVAGHLGIPIRQGIYLGVTGPSYETPAEIRMYRTLGADAVGMSTVPEVIVAVQMGIPVLGISCITNMAAGMEPRKITHSDVLKTAKKLEEKFRILLNGIIKMVAGRRSKV
jgi:purine-nucleoside phosphorylase